MNKFLTLDSLAVEVNALHEQAESFANQAVVYAARCGAKLIEAKAQCAHGEWLPWLEANCRVNARQSQRYMKVATKYPQLLDSNTSLKSHLPGIDQAIALLSAPDEVKEAVQEKLSSGEHVTVKEIEELKRRSEPGKASAKSRLRQLLGDIRSEVRAWNSDLDSVAAQIHNGNVQANISALGSLLSDLIKEGYGPGSIEWDMCLAMRDSEIKAMSIVDDIRRAA